MIEIDRILRIFCSLHLFRITDDSFIIGKQKCWNLFNLLGRVQIIKKDGTLHKHGHGGGNEHPCPGSYKLPNSTVLSSEQSQQRADSQQTKINREARAAPPPSNIYDTSGSPIEHPQWKTLINRIPKAARAQCATAFCETLLKIIADPATLNNWKSLFTFAPTILAKPPRGGANRNLATLFLRDWPDARTIHQPPKVQRSNTRRRAPEDRMPDWLLLSRANWRQEISAPQFVCSAQTTFQRHQLPKR